MDDIEDHKEDLQAHYDAAKQEIENGEAEYTENFAAITDALGIAHFKSDPSRALELLKEALSIRRDKICAGRDDESVVTSLNNVCILLRKLDDGRVAEAVGVYQRQAVEMFCRLYPDSRHLNAAANLNSLVDVMNDCVGGIATIEDDVRYLSMAVERFRKYFAAKKANEKIENDPEGVKETAAAQPDPINLHFVSTLKKLAGRLEKMQSSQCHERAVTCLEEARMIEVMLEEFERKNKETE